MYMGLGLVESIDKLIKLALLPEKILWLMLTPVYILNMEEPYIEESILKKIKNIDSQYA
jgi:hypothetical protein